MAAVAGAKSSTLNPNAAVFIPASFRQVEDFSPEWWELIKTSAWFRDYWLSQHQEESFATDDDEGDPANWLPDSFDLGFDEEFLDLDTDTVFQEFLEPVSKENIEEKNQRNGFGISNNNDAKAVLRSLSMPKSPKEKSPKPRYFEKAAKCVSPRPRVGRIQQPR